MGDAESHLSDAERLLSHKTDAAQNASAPLAPMRVVDEAAFQALPSRMALARAFQEIAAGDIAGAIGPTRRALELLPADEHHWRGAAAVLLGMAHWRTGDLGNAQNFHAEGVSSLERAGDVVLALSAAYHGGDLLKARGLLWEAHRRYDRSLQLAGRHGDLTLPGVASLHYGLSELYCEQGDLESARHHLQLGRDLGYFPAIPATPYRHCLAQAHLLQAEGDLAGALDALERAEHLYTRSAIPEFRPLGAWKARLRLAQGSLEEAVRWTKAQGLSVDDTLDYAKEFHHITLARVLIAQAHSRHEAGSLHEVDQLLQRLAEAAEAGGRNAALIEILVLQAVIRGALGDISAGLLPLERALALAEPEGYVHVFIDEGAALLGLLQGALEGPGERPYLQRLVSRLEKHPQAGPAPGDVGGAPIADGLTAREVEILRLIGSGMSNQEVAENLVISLWTVKRHISNAYAKLNVSHRTAALLRANELNLL